ncbi:MAG: fibronectin type III domain-containing protein [Thermoanaerobaculia bacterium]
MRPILVAAAVVTLFSGTLAPEAWAVRLDESRIIIELNSTDQDVGIQIFLDGEHWKRLKVFDPDGNKIFDVKGKGSVGALGVTELFMESEEPSLEDLPLDDFLALFPEGKYRFVGRTVDGRELKGTARFTHAIPEGPFLVQPAEGAVVDPDNTVVEWQAVADPPGSEIVGYQVIVEREDEVRVIDIKLSADITSVTIPPEFMEPGTEYKFEVLAIEDGGNQTISERAFETE